MNATQKAIITIVNEWVHTNNEPITLTEITKRLNSINPRTLRASAEVLCKKGYFRRGTIGRTASYVRIRSI